MAVGWGFWCTGVNKKKNSTFFYVEKAMGLGPQGPQGPQGRAPGAPGPIRFPMPRPQRLKGPYRKNNSFFLSRPQAIGCKLQSPLPPRVPSSGNQRFLQKKYIYYFFFQGPMPWSSGPRGPSWGLFHIKKNSRKFLAVLRGG